jgi:hypothetical protein
LKPTGAKGHDERVSVTQGVASLGTYERKDGRRLMHDPGVIEHEKRPPIAHREAAAIGPVRVEHARLSATHSMSRDDEHGNEVHSISMRALRRRSADALRRFDAESMGLHEPRTSPSKRVGPLAKPPQYPRPLGHQNERWQQGLEPPLEAAVQSVVLYGLPVRAVRLRVNCPSIDDEAAVSPSPIPSAIPEVSVYGEVGPVRRNFAERSLIGSEGVANILAPDDRKSPVPQGWIDAQKRSPWGVDVRHVPLLPCFT